MSTQTARGPRVAEGKPWETTNSDGSTNFGSYAFLAVEGMVQLAHELLIAHHGIDSPPRPDAVGRLARSLLLAADRAQAGIRADGHVDRSDNSHTRARGALRAALEVHPVPFDRPDAGPQWVEDITAYAITLLNIGANLLALEPTP